MKDIVVDNYFKVKNLLRRGYWLSTNHSFSQKGEDLELFKLLNKKK